MKSEVWRAVRNYEGKYEVSSLGQVRSLRYCNKVCDKLRTEPLILKLGNNRRHGYYNVVLSKRTFLVHGLVAEAFLGKRPNGAHAAHLDGNPLNNRVDNLMWATPKINASHKKLHGTHISGSKSPNAKLSESDVKAIRKAAKLGERQCTLAKLYGVHFGTISRIILRKGWNYV